MPIWGHQWRGGGDYHSNASCIGSLRLGVVGCFIGHRVYGLLTKEVWVPYFCVVGIDWTCCSSARPSELPVPGTSEICQRRTRMQGCKTRRLILPGRLTFLVVGPIAI
jgi:hypothetical protein